MIVAMVVIGGITRLTGSGLSMVQWAPLFGAIPPLSEKEWLAVFEQYKQFPQYQHVNHWMDLSDFKNIFFWEYVHRLWGRLIGLVFFFPMVWFWVRGQFEGLPKSRIFAAFVLGGMQGIVGWIMVKSGLVDVPAVSHFRLALHFGLALFVSQWLLWLIWDVRELSLPQKNLDSPELHSGKAVTFAFYGLLWLQLIYGALMAGSRAGYLYQTFPKMNGEWIPSSLARVPNLVGALMNNPVGIHFVHRALGFMLLVLGIYLGVVLIKENKLGKTGYWLLGALYFQFLLGIGTVISGVNITFAVFHQLGGVALLSISTWVVYSLGRSKITGTTMRLR